MKDNNMLENEATTSSSTISKSKAKRLAQQQARKKTITKIKPSVILAIIIPILVIGCAVFLYNYGNNTKGIYSQFLNTDGTLKEDSSLYCSISMNDVSLKSSDIESTDALVESEIYSLINEYTTVDKDTSHVIATGDKIDVAYTATIDGQEYESYTETKPRALTMGFGTLQPDVDNALIGSNIGTTVTVDIEFPENWTNPDVAGKTVHYELTSIGVYTAPAFDDNFVLLHCSDSGATTADEFRAKLKEQYENQKLEELISATMTEYCVITSYPNDFLARLAEDQKANNMQQVDQYAQLGYNVSIYDVYGVQNEPDPEASYNALVMEEAQNILASIIRTDAIAKYYGITVTKKEVRDYFYDNGTTKDTFLGYIETYGWGYLSNHYLQVKVMDCLKEKLPRTEN